MFGQVSAQIFDLSTDLAEIVRTNVLILGDFSLRRWRRLDPKRIFDFSVALLALLALSPLMLMIAFIIKVSVGGHVFFAHHRVGRNGRIFPCYKFRTMIPNSAEVLERYLANNLVAREEWSASHKLARDPRVTVIGLFIRKLSLDELPQFYNVIRGEMSLVGPRPVTRDELARYGEYADDYVSVRPGLTGLWQVSGRSSRTYDERVALDRVYVRRRTFWLDCALLLKTIPAVMKLHESA
jgi:lipopolysaccharide/colanic/teichoic acid biosynthesis glycosyltransferase